MRISSLIFAAVVCVGCGFRAPVAGQLAINVRVQVSAQARVADPPPPPPPPPVALQGAAVVEFFGIPLEDAQDVVFVLDCSGSMAEPAQGRIAQIAVAGPPAAPPDPPAALPPPAFGQPAPEPPTDSYAAAPPPQPLAAPGHAAPLPRPRKIDVAQAELVDALSRLPIGTRLNVLFFNRGLEAYAIGLFPLEETRRYDLMGYVRETGPTGPTALAPAMRTAFLMNARRIVLLSDGLGNIGGGALSVLHDAREGMRGGVRIDTIGLGNHQDRELLSTLARESGGIYQAL